MGPAEGYSPALFVGRLTDRLSQNGVRKMLSNISSASTVDHVHPHKFRRTLATSLIRHGMPIQEVAAILRGAAFVLEGGDEQCTRQRMRRRCAPA